MSTKIYNAYRIKDTDRVWEVLSAIRARGEQEAVDRLRAFYLKNIEELDTDAEEYRAERRKDSSGKEASARLWFVDAQVRKRFKEQATSSARDVYDPEVTIAVTHHATGFYLRAFCDRVSLFGGSLDFLDDHPDLEDFHYQDQSDRPKAVSPEAWRERRRIWTEMADASGFFKDQLIMEISSYQSSWRLSPLIDLLREFADKPPTLPSREEVLARTLRKLETVQGVEARAGCIEGTTTVGQSFAIKRVARRAQKNQWTSRIDGRLKRHANLGKAVDHAYLQLMPAEHREQIERWIARHAEKAGRKPKAKQP